MNFGFTYYLVLGALLLGAIGLYIFVKKKQG